MGDADRIETQDGDSFLHPEGQEEVIEHGQIHDGGVIV